MSANRNLIALIGGGACLLVALFAASSLRRSGEPARGRPSTATADEAPDSPIDTRTAAPSRDVAESSPAITTLTVRTIDPTGGALSGVAVDWRSRNGPPRELGASDSTGRLQLPSILEVGVLTASRSDRESVSVRLDLTRPHDDVTLVLGREGSLRGQVVLPTGDDAGAGIRVAAWQSSLGAIEIDRPESLDAAPGGRCVITDASGRFSIRGLRAGAPYDLIAGGQGFATRERLRGVAADGQELQIELHALFGVVARFVDARTGQAVVLPEGLLPAVTNTLAVRAPGAKLLDARQTLALVGLPFDVFDAWPTVRTCFVTLPPDTIAAGDALASLECDLPGYLPTTAELILQPIVQTLPEQVIKLFPNAKERADFELVAVGLPVSRELVHTRLSPELEVVLFAEQGSPIALQFERVPNEPHLIHGIPAGSYRVRAGAKLALSKCSWSRDAPFAVGVAGAAPERLVIDLSGLGGLVIHLQQIDSTPYAGPVVIDVRKPTGDPGVYEMCHVELRTDPYEIFGLAPGSYDVAVRSPAFVQPDVATVNVAPGAWAEAVFRVDASH